MANEQKQEASVPQPAPQVITADLNQLTDLISVSVAKAMGQMLLAFQQSQGGQQFNPLELGKVISSAIVEGIGATTRKTVSFGEYSARGDHSPFHNQPEKYAGERMRQAWLTRPCYQNNSPLFEDTLHDDEIELLNQISHSGRYCDRLVEVIVSNEGQVDETVEIRHANTPNGLPEVLGAAGFNRRQHKSGFHAILASIVADQDVERAEAEAKNDVKKARPGQGHIGGSKAFLEAKARAEAKQQGKSE